MNKIFDNIHIIIPYAWVYPGYQRFFSRAVEIFGVGFARVTIKTWQKPETALEKSVAPRVAWVPRLTESTTFLQVQSVFTHVASIYANLKEQQKRGLHKKRVQLPQD